MKLFTKTASVLFGIWDTDSCFPTFLPFSGFGNLISKINTL